MAAGAAAKNLPPALRASFDAAAAVASASPPAAALPLPRASRASRGLAGARAGAGADVDASPPERARAGCAASSATSPSSSLLLPLLPRAGAGTGAAFLLRCCGCVAARNAGAPLCLAVLGPESSPSSSDRSSPGRGMSSEWSDAAASSTSSSSEEAASVTAVLAARFFACGARRGCTPPVVGALRLSPRRYLLVDRCLPGVQRAGLRQRACNQVRLSMLAR